MTAPSPFCLRRAELRWRGVAVFLIALGTGLGQGAPCPPPPPLTPLQNGGPVLQGAPLEAWVDPANGNDGTAQVGTTQAFKTLAGALSSLGPMVQQLQAPGTVRLLAGWYGFNPASSLYNGERWPVFVPPGVSIRGVSAMNVMLDGAAIDPMAPTIAVAHPLSGTLRPVRPVLVFGDPLTLTGYSRSLLSRVSVVRGEIGVLVQGEGEIDPTFGHVLFSGCDVGVQVHSTGPAIAGIHRPKVVWCTFGNCNVGVAVTSTILAPLMIPRARPSIVNGLFKCGVDFEGLACSDVDTTAFGLSRFNVGSAVVPPTNPPTSVFNADFYSLRDLFIGAQSLPVGVNPAQMFLTDFRLAFETNGVGVNPALTGSIESFPLTLSNGTSVAVSFPGDILGTSGGGEANGTGTPPSGAGMPTGLSLGYDPAGTVQIGGTMPMTDGFGIGFGGTFSMFRMYLRQTPIISFLYVVSGMPTPYTPGRLDPLGVLSPQVSVGGMLGTLALDFSYPSLDLTPILGAIPGTYGALGAQWSVPLAAGIGPARVDFVAQMAYLSPTFTLVLTDPQRFYIAN